MMLMPLTCRLLMTLMTHGRYLAAVSTVIATGYAATRSARE